MNPLARELRQLRREKKEVTSIGILYMTQLTNNYENLQRHVNIDRMAAGEPVRTVIEHGQQVNVYQL